MQNNEEHIDQLFRKELDGYEVMPPAEVWNMISSSLAEKKKKNRVIWMFRFAGAAVVVFAFLSGWYFSGNPDWSQPMVQTQSVDELITPQDREESLAVETLSASNLVNSSMNNQSSVDPPVISGQRVSVCSNSSVKNMSSSIDPIAVCSNQSSGNDRLAVQPKEPSMALKLMNTFRSHVVSGHKPNDRLLAMNTSTGLTDADRAVIAANIAALKPTSERDKLRISALGAQVNPMSNIDFSGSSNKDYANFYSSNQATGGSGYRSSVGAGIQVEVKANKRFSVQTGLNYNALVADGGSIGVSFINQNWLSGRGSDLVYSVSSPGIVQVEATSNAALKTDNGMVNVNIPGGSQVSASLVMANDLGLYEAASSFSIDQKAGYIELPMLLKYRLVGNKLGLDLLGGVNTSFLILNRVLLLSQQDKVAQGYTEGLASVTFSGNMGIGLDYRIGSSFSLSFQPIFRMQLNSLNTQAEYDIRPLSLGVYSGISWVF